VRRGLIDMLDGEAVEENGPFAAFPGAAAGAIQRLAPARGAEGRQWQIKRVR